MKHLLFSLLLCSIGIQLYSINIEIDTINPNLIHYKIFNDNGNLIEEAYWSNNKNVGLFKRYHQNGKLAQEFFFNDSGVRVGAQSYFYDNEEVNIVGIWLDEKLNGYWMRYNKMGNITEINGNTEEETQANHM